MTTKNKKNLKISNDFVNSLIVKNNYLTLKILFYMVLNGKTEEELTNKINEMTEEELKKDNLKLIKITLKLKDIKNFLNTDLKNLRRDIKNIQKTIITITHKKDITDLNLIPLVNYKYNSQEIEIHIFKIILKELKDLQNKFTIIDLSNLIYLKNKHSIKLLTLLENIDTYDTNKTKTLNKDELNKFFGTNYAGIKEIERSILKPIKKELDEFSKLSFNYNLDYDIDTLKVGRKPLVGVKIFLKDNKIRQLSLNL